MSARFGCLDEWLAWLDGLHPRKMDLGLARVSEVARRLEVTRPASTIVTVAGTNGKGSTVRCLESLLCAHGVDVGSTYSPHLHRFNERILINGEPVSDVAIVDAFAQIDDARREISLTYFEFGALAALICFRNAASAVALLEVGLGGRLDAVNLCDADLAVITSIDLDHQAYLGDDRESIGREKAGILRAGVPLVIGETDPPESVLRTAAQLGCQIYQQGSHFGFTAPARERSWQWWWRGAGTEEQMRDLPYGGIALENAASALMALRLLQGAPRLDAVRSALARTRMPGRFEIIAGEVPVILDVAHNPHGARHLAARLRHEPRRRTLGVLGVLADKDGGAVAAALADLVEAWFVAPVEDPRGMPVADLEKRVRDTGARCSAWPSLAQAMSQARCAARPGDRVLVCGSFSAVAQARELVTVGAASS